MPDRCRHSAQPQGNALVVTRLPRQNRTTVVCTRSRLHCLNLVVHGSCINHHPMDHAFPYASPAVTRAPGPCFPFCFSGRHTCVKCSSELGSRSRCDAATTPCAALGRSGRFAHDGHQSTHQKACWPVTSSCVVMPAIAIMARRPLFSSLFCMESRPASSLGLRLRGSKPRSPGW